MSDKIQRFELEEKMQAALDEPGAVLDFYRVLLDSTVFASGQTYGVDQFSLTPFTSEGKIVFPIFTSRERCERYFPNSSCFSIQLPEMLSKVPKDAHILVNPDDSLHSYVFNDLLVQALMTGEMFQVDEKSFNGSFYTGPLRQPKASLKKLLRNILSRHEQVEAGFMSVIFEPRSAYPPCPAIGLAGAGDLLPAIQECQAAIDAETEDRVVIYAMADDALSLYAGRNTSPFYWKTPPVEELPEPMSRETIVATLKAISNDSVITNSLLKTYLHSEQSEAEAKAMWRSLQPETKRRYGNPEAFTAAYLKSKKQEIEDYKASSTHAQARRVLLDALTRDGRFCLLLHDFAGEATQYLENMPGKELQRVRWLSFPARTVDDPLRKFLRSLPYPAAGVANPNEAIRLWSIVPLLELADREWLRLVVSLISVATLIVLVIENPGLGLLHELFAIQKLGREDQTLILVPDKESEHERQKVFDMLAGSAGEAPININNKPMASDLLGMMSTYGRVETWSEFAWMVEHIDKIRNPHPPTAT
jgi:hypothetical protein